MEGVGLRVKNVGCRIKNEEWRVGVNGGGYHILLVTEGRMQN